MVENQATLKHRRRPAAAPRFSVIDSTTPRLSLAEAAVTYAQAGAEGIGISESSIRDIDTDAEAVRRSGLTVTGCFPDVASILPPRAGPVGSSYGLSGPGLREPRARVAEIIVAMERLAPLKPSWINLVTGPRGAYDAGKARAILVNGLRELSAAAAALNTGVALEVFHPSLDDWSFANSIPEAAAIIDEVARPNVALALDVWHLTPGDDEMLGDLRRHAARAVSFHINDRRQPTRSVWDRVLPGDGVADVAGMLGSLDSGGFDGWYELEILSDDGRVEHDFPDSLWRRDPREVVATGRAQFLALWESRREPAIAQADR
jgi:sugar phosphate isomerase/epimerase